jgi:hypothetical protein
MAGPAGSIILVQRSPFTSTGDLAARAQKYLLPPDARAKLGIVRVSKDVDCLHHAPERGLGPSSAAAAIPGRISLREFALGPQRGRAQPGCEMLLYIYVRA